MSLKSTMWMLIGLAIATALFGLLDSLFAKPAGGWISLPGLVPFLAYSTAAIVGLVALGLWLVLTYAKPNGVLSAFAQIVGVLVFLAGGAALGWAVFMELPIMAYQPSRKDPSNARFPIRVDKKFGFIDKAGKIVIAPQFDAVNDFSEDRARFYQGSLAGYIDLQGQVVIDPKYVTATDFKNGRAVVLEGSQYLVIDRTGAVIAKVPHRVLGDFHQDMVRLQKSGGTDANGKREITVYGYMSREGKVVIEPKYLPASEFPDDGGLAVGGLNHEWHYFDKNGKVIFRVPQPQRLEGFTTFHNGLLRRKEGFLWGYQDARGEWKIKPKYDDARDFSADGTAAVELAGKWIEINADGNTVKRPAWRALAPSSDGLRLVREGDRTGWLNDNDKQAFAFRKYDDAKSFHCGLAAVKVDGFWGYLDKSGNLAIRAVFNSAGDFREDLAWVMTNEGETGYINPKGDFVWKSAPLPKLNLKPITGPKPPTPRQ